MWQYMIDFTSIDIDNCDFESGSLGEKDTSHVGVDESDYEYQDDSINLTNTYIPDEFDVDDISSISLKQQVESIENDDRSFNHDHEYRSSSIAFTGNGRCRICNCGGWAGFGDICANCGHFYNKHI